MATESYILELKLDTSKDSDRNYLNNYFTEVAVLSNTVRRIAIRQLSLLRRNPQYKKLLKQYVSLDKKDPRKKELSSALTDIVRSYGLHKYGLDNFARYKRYNLKYIHSDVYAKICDDVWRSVEKNLYGAGKKIHFKKWNEFTSFENKKNSTGIIYQDGYVYINCSQKRPKGGIKLKVKLPKNKSSKHYKYELECLNDKTKYCRIVRRTFKNGWHYYIQLVQEGTPPQLFAKNKSKQGRVGVDIGTSTAAIVSKNSCKLKELGTTHEQVKQFDKKIKVLQRKLDRSKRASNPQNYNEDGTVKKGRKTWSYSNTYYKTRNLLRTLHRKRSANLKQWQEAFVNTVLEDGNTIFVESMSFNGLAKKSKKTGLNSKGKIKKKKRFGKSIQMHAPAQFIAILQRKANYYGGALFKINTYKFKASQYNHLTGDYKKKKLSERRTLIGNDTIQRDLYSAFLLMNSDDSLIHTDRDLCFKEYDSFKINHDRCINELKELKNLGTKLSTNFGV